MFLTQQAQSVLNYSLGIINSRLFFVLHHFMCQSRINHFTMRSGSAVYDMS